MAVAKPADLWRWVVPFALALALVPGAARAADTDAACRKRPHRVIVRAVNLRSAKGLVTAVLYGDSGATFLKKGARLSKERVPAMAGSVELCLPAPGPGRYAVATYHDENGNRKFDKNWIGIPIEG